MRSLNARLIIYSRTNLWFGLKRRDEQIMTLEEIAKYAFMAFAAIAIVAGLAVGYMAYDAGSWADSSVADINGYVMLIMLILGIIVGVVSVTSKEVTPFLIAAIALIVTGTGISVWSPLSKVHELLYYWATAILTYFVAFAAPAAVIIAGKSIWAIAKEK
jgi:peptidoglycan/LPS O-acetylase OafA/YrhL